MGDKMKRIICALALLLLLRLPVQAAGPQYVALTFDDGPSGRFTAALLDGLAQRQVPATFFLCGYRVEQYPELAARIAAEGHEIGLHGDTHRYFTDLSPTEICQDLSAAREKILAATGQEPTLLRPPGGLYDLERLHQTSCADLPVILWSVDPQDWRGGSREAIASAVIHGAKNGDIILLHDMSDATVAATFTIIDTLMAQDYQFVTVSELARSSGTELMGAQAYFHFDFAKKERISSAEAATEP